MSTVNRYARIWPAAAVLPEGALTESDPLSIRHPGRRPTPSTGQATWITAAKRAKHGRSRHGDEEERQNAPVQFSNVTRPSKQFSRSDLGSSPTNQPRKEESTLRRLQRQQVFHHGRIHYAIPSSPRIAQYPRWSPICDARSQSELHKWQFRIELLDGKVWIWCSPPWSQKVCKSTLSPRSSGYSFGGSSNLDQSHGYGKDCIHCKTHTHGCRLWSPRALVWHNTPIFVSPHPPVPYGSSHWLRYFFFF